LYRMFFLTHTTEMAEDHIGATQHMRKLKFQGYLVPNNIRFIPVFSESSYFANYSSESQISECVLILSLKLGHNSQRRNAETADF
jgi:hypothetical protein